MRKTRSFVFVVIVVLGLFVFCLLNGRGFFSTHRVSTFLKGSHVFSKLLGKHFKDRIGKTVRHWAGMPSAYMLSFQAVCQSVPSSSTLWDHCSFVLFIVDFKAQNTQLQKPIAMRWGDVRGLDISLPAANEWWEG